jgi:hypothetical protein
MLCTTNQNEILNNLKRAHNLRYAYVLDDYVCFRSLLVATSSRERRWRRYLTALLRDLLRGDTREGNNYTEHV